MSCNSPLDFFFWEKWNYLMLSQLLEDEEAWSCSSLSQIRAELKEPRVTRAQISAGFGIIQEQGPCSSTAPSGLSSIPELPLPDSWMSQSPGLPGQISPSVPGPGTQGLPLSLPVPHPCPRSSRCSGGGFGSTVPPSVAALTPLQGTFPVQ